MKRTLADLGVEVRSRREQLGVTQREASIAARISDTTWSKVEAGEKVSDRTLRAVARALLWTSDSPFLILQGKRPQAVGERGSRIDLDQSLTAEDLAKIQGYADGVAAERRAAAIDFAYAAETDELGRRPTSAGQRNRPEPPPAPEST